MLTLKLRPLFIKKTCSTQILQQLTHTLSSSQQKGLEWSPVYNFPPIKALAIINKAKLYQTLGTIVGIPGCYGLSLCNLCSYDIFAAITSLGITGCVLLHTLGFMFSNTVGIIYLHNTGESAKVSYLDNWGSRRETIIPLKEIVPFCDLSRKITDPLYLQLTQYTSKDKFKLNVNYGIVHDPKKFELIFSKTSNNQ